MTDAHPDPTDDVDEEPEEETYREHLDGVEDGCGCAEIWEHLSRNRQPDA